MRKQLLSMNLFHLIIIGTIIILFSIFLRVSYSGFFPPTEEPYKYMLFNNLLFETLFIYIPLNQLILSFIISAFFSLLFLILSYLFLVKFLSKEISVVAILMIIFSPYFVNSVLINSEVLFSVIWILFALNLIASQNRLVKILGCLSSLIIPFISLFYVFVFLIFLWSYVIYNNNNNNNYNPYQKNNLKIRPFNKYLFYLISFILLILSGIVHRSSNIIINLREELFRNSLTDLGALYGFGTFSLFLAVIGFFYIWERKKELWPFYLSFFIILISWIFSTDSGIILNLLFSVFSAYAILRLSFSRWKLIQVKKVSILLICCGLLFSFISYSTILISAKPNKELIENLNWLKELPKGVILTDPSIAIYSKYFSENEVINLEEDITIQNDTERMFYGRNLDKAIALFIDYDISYLIITEEMKTGKIWKKEDEGLLFLLQNNETFKKIKQDTGIEIWQISINQEYNNSLDNTQLS